MGQSNPYPNLAAHHAVQERWQGLRDGPQLGSVLWIKHDQTSSDSSTPMKFARMNTQLQKIYIYINKYYYIYILYYTLYIIYKYYILHD